MVEPFVIALDRRARQGWDAAFQAAGASTDDELVLDRIGPNEFDEEEWQWV